jgi:hypothetical protein
MMKESKYWNFQKRKQGEGETESEKAAGKMKAMAKKMEGLQGSEKEQMEEDVKCWGIR